MLQEIVKVRQNPDEPRKRWFTDSTMDLYAWYSETNEIVGFQLVYDKPHAEKALTWNLDHGFGHSRIDDGTRSGRHPGSPLLAATTRLEADRLVADFRANADNIEMEVENFVVEMISSQIPAWCGADADQRD